MRTPTAVFTSGRGRVWTSRDEKWIKYSANERDIFVSHFCWPGAIYREVTPLLLLGTVSCDTGVDTTTISTENSELRLAKNYENSSLDHSLFCAFDPRSNAGLLRERTRDDHDYNTSDYCNGPAAYVYPNAHYGGLIRGRPLIAAAPFSGANANSLPLKSPLCLCVSITLPTSS